MNNKTLKVLEFDKVINKLDGFAASSLGKSYVKNLMPSCDFDTVQYRLKETTDGVNFILKLGYPALGGIKDIRNSLKRANMNGMLNCKELLEIADTLRVSRTLTLYLNKDREILGDNILLNIIENLYTNKRVEDNIFFAIKNEESLNDNASRELYSIRRQKTSSQILIKNKLQELVKDARYTKYMRDAIVTIRDGRYVVPVKQEYRGEISGLIHDASSSGATVFIEPIAVVEANNKIKQLRIKEKIEIEKILLKLTGEVREIIDQLEQDVNNLGRIDFIFAKANFSLKYNCIEPALSRENIIEIKSGRHLLLDQKTVVPIDCWIGKDYKTLVITGPNTGGKTVTLKTVGLFSLMTQSGLQIPAKAGTIMTVFDKIYADIGDEQSIEQSLSTFSSHIKNIVRILENADSSSLVLLDEIGAGTDPEEGAALAMSILDYLKAFGTTTIATTHYSELKVYASTTNLVENASCEFNIATLKPTYKLLIGVPGRSNAFLIAQKLGMSDSIIDKAKKLLTQEQIKFEDMLSKIEENVQQTESEKSKTESLRVEIEKMQKEVLAQKEKLKKEKDKMLKEARLAARKVLEDAKKEANDIINEMKRATQIEEEAKRNKEIEKNRLRLKKQMDFIDESLEEQLLKTITPRNGYSSLKIKDLKVGDSVTILNLNKNGTVVKINESANEVIVLVGILKLTCHISNLRKIQEKKVKTTGIGTRKTKSVSTKIDVRGNNLEEAIYLVDKYLDDVSLSNLSNVTIVHGKGSGVLREGIQTFLKKNPHVKSFRNGNYGEGEFGVTIVELKK